MPGLRRKVKPKADSATTTNSGPCLHAVHINNLCVSCGKRIEIPNNNDNVTGPAPSNTVSTLTLTGGSQLTLSEAEVKKQQLEKASALKNAKKLALVLDLDHTLIHTMAVAVPPNDASYCTEHQLEHMCIEERVNDGMRSMTLYKHFLIKKRPHLDTFLKTMSSLFQLSIYTAGTRRYAEGVAKIIDPTSKLFNGRIVSRSDITASSGGAKAAALGLEKSLQRIFLGDASMAIILDDREDVWRGGQSRQLMLVRPFVHFRGGHEVNNSSGYTSSNDHMIPLLECDTLAEVPDPATATPVEGVQGAEGPPGGGVFMPHSHLDDQLVRCESLLTQIHTMFYSSTLSGAGSENGNGDAINSSDNNGQKEAAPGSALSPPPSLGATSTADLLTSLKSTILRGCVVTFSGLIPNNEPEPHLKCLLWRVAERLGAQVSWEVTLRTTHLVTTSTSTTKVQESYNNGDNNVWIVHPDWLMYCCWSLTRASERLFLSFPVFEGGRFPAPILDSSPLPPQTLPEAAQRTLARRNSNRSLPSQTSRTSMSSSISSDGGNSDDGMPPGKRRKAEGSGGGDGNDNESISGDEDVFGDDFDDTLI